MGPLGKKEIGEILDRRCLQAMQGPAPLPLFPPPPFTYGNGKILSEGRGGGEKENDLQGHKYMPKILSRIGVGGKKGGFPSLMYFFLLPVFTYPFHTQPFYPVITKAKDKKSPICPFRAGFFLISRANCQVNLSPFVFGLCNPRRKEGGGGVASGRFCVPFPYKALGTLNLQWPPLCIPPLLQIENGRKKNNNRRFPHRKKNPAGAKKILC